MAAPSDDLYEVPARYPQDEWSLRGASGAAASGFLSGAVVPTAGI
jgi:hypothetical protein